MKFTIPPPLQQAQAALHERRRQTTRIGGEVGDAAEAPAAGPIARQQLGRRAWAAA